ncbi:carboxymuconolactone decarboxylase family protein [Leifsonia sp. A12D58]|uniref:carboxymuconolactone decarboxylase family protein n=1 Tax=Leifsonia sp. A12D58 TaxID=3397674 RepID=UPI0039E1D477
MIDTTDVPVRLEMDTIAEPFVRALASLDAATSRVLDSASIEPPLRELVRIRASQINGCAYCVDVHTTDALASGETVRRLAAIAVWNESAAFTERERAALAFTEVVTLAASTRVPDDAVAAARRLFTETELAAVLSLIVTITAWNMVGVAARPWPVDYSTRGQDAATVA